MGNESAVERGAGEEIDRQFQIGGGGDFATATRLCQDVPRRFAAALGELGVEAPQGRIAVRGVDERGHQPGERPVADQAFEQGEELDQIGTQCPGRGQAN